MESCNYQHVPARLHTGEKLPIPNFEVGEHIYRRCKEEEIANPFLTIDLKELSVNRRGLAGNTISEEADVLINITADNAENYPLQVCTMVIRDLNVESGTYDKDFNQEKGGQNYVAKVKLIHDPDKCMYPHCVFRIWLGDALVTRENYKTTLKKMDKLKDKIRLALGAMVLQKQISQTLT